MQLLRRARRAWPVLLSVSMQPASPRTTSLFVLLLASLLASCMDVEERDGTPTMVSELPPSAEAIHERSPEATNVSNDVLGPPPATPVGQAQIAGSGPQLVFVNFDGGTLTKCSSAHDARDGCWSHLNQTSQNYGGWGEYWGRQMILNHVRMAFEGYNVQVTDVRPSNASYTMVVLTHTLINSPLGGDNQSWFRGVAKMVDCGNVSANDIVIVVDQAEAASQGRANFANRVELAGKLISHELGHAFGLDHTDWKFDLMHNRVDEGVAFVYARKLTGTNENHCLQEHTHQDGPHRLATWVGTAPLPQRRRLNSAPAVVSMTPGHYDVFATASNGEIIHRWYWGGWSGWESLGGFATSPPAVVSWANGRIDLFVRGWNEALHHKWYTSSGGWSHWEDLGGHLTSGPSAASPAEGILDVYVRGTDNEVHRKAYWGGWGEWQWVGGGWKIIGAPAAVSWGAGHLDFYVRGTDDAMWHRWWTGNGWSNFEYLGGVLYSSPGVMAVTPGIIDTYHRGTDSAIWRRAYWNGWGGYESMGGIVSSGPGVGSWAVGRHDIFVRGPDYTLQHKYYDGYWRDWYAL
jgi:hypothetical protein